MKLLNLRMTALASVALVAAVAACSSSSSGGGSTGDGGNSSSSSGSSGSSSGGGDSGGPTGTPTIAITSPTAGASVAVTQPDDTVPVVPVVTNFDLQAAGSCPADLKSTDNCGHIHLLVDGAACTPAGSPYNNASGAPPVTSIEAVLSDCPTVNGAHTITLELHHDDHTPITDSSGATISASVMITATGG